ncbi:murein transglycosylase A [Sedimentitalea sp. JM2-8]|uniref:peptidoglycan lytic exotransglycosylase n=1 Tax=Sedimentitalea xiamensis TaxID=3050037 RepID=A0ABT7FAB0_9RHOB|nr:murein transglycosylase A [Sedimentitalea xiamensis]MDK3071789.1 murein transglycosylase A [Sedimentitalea xiamensis]
MIAALGAVLLAGAVLMTSDKALAETTYDILGFDDLDGWKADDHGAALAVFLNSCADLDDPDWHPVCVAAKTQAPGAARGFFETLFRPVLIRDGQSPLFTGYFEPELNGSRLPTDRFRHPLYLTPPEAEKSRPWLSRRGLLETKSLENRNLEIAWVDDPVDLFFLQIQGSGRIRLPDGQVLRVGYGGTNGHPYRSIGAELVRRGVFSAQRISAEGIKSWIRLNPEAGQELMYHNPSYVFFRELSHVAPEHGPLGAMNRSVTPLRSVAVDPEFTPLGAPVWVETDGAFSLRRLMVAQDTGSAIKGAQRADIFFGTGAAAGQSAGRLRYPGRLVVLLPLERAMALDPDRAG